MPFRVEQDESDGISLAELDSGGTQGEQTFSANLGRTTRALAVVAYGDGDVTVDVGEPGVSFIEMGKSLKVLVFGWGHKDKDRELTVQARARDGSRLQVFVLWARQPVNAIRGALGKLSNTKCTVCKKLVQILIGVALASAGLPSVDADTIHEAVQLLLKGMSTGAGLPQAVTHFLATLGLSSVNEVLLAILSVVGKFLGVLDDFAALACEQLGCCVGVTP